jgi:t-SNARE complex subunit (syntaxin)
MVKENAKNADGEIKEADKNVDSTGKKLMIILFLILLIVIIVVLVVVLAVDI